MNSYNIKPPHGAETIGWVDFMRVLAVFLVVLAHSCDAFTGYFSTLGAGSANPMLTPADYTASTLLNRLWTWIFNFNFDTVPLWYLYILIGLYLIMPMLASWLSRASRRAVVASAASLALCWILDRWRPTRRLIA